LSEVKEILKKGARETNIWLDRLLPGEDEEPCIIHKAMRYSVFAGGKRLRPTLAVLAYKWAGGDGDKIYPPACGLELIHTYSLIHDDLPSMDNDDLRRGKPTNHMVYGDAMAILAGDALHALAFELLSKSDSIEVIREVASNIGTAGLVGGQVLDIISEGKSPDRETVEKIHKGKTAALIRTSLRIGVILAGAIPEELKSITDYGDNMGLAFQVVDDILDITADQKDLGKPIGSDLEKGKATYPAVYGIEKSREIAGELIEAAKSALLQQHQNEELIAIADFMLNRVY